MGGTRRFTILHSNDMHGDFLAEQAAGGGPLTGGLPLLSGYLNKVRAEEENVIYAISGDMLQGSIIDSDFKGVSTIEIMNYLAPDIVGLGNHEVDYGVPHLLFLEKIANFPIVNANLYIKPFNKRMMRPHYVMKKAGLDILFTGILTEKALDAIKLDELIGTFVDIREAADEVGRICNAYRNDDIDLTVLLTHIGFESDKELAAALDPAWGVDMIIGGHSHTVLSEPAVVNGVLIVQAGTGTDQIGRFDIVVDDDTNSIVEWRWQLIPIDENIAAPDRELMEFIDSFKTIVDRKYGVVLCKLAHEHTHPERSIETSLGDLVADALAEQLAIDVMLLGAGSVRVERFGPTVTLMDLMSCFPYDDSITRFTVTGATLRAMLEHWMRPENRLSGEGECYEVNGAVRARYSDAERRLVSLSVHGMPVADDDLVTVGLQGYHISNCEPYLGVTPEQLQAAGPSKVVTTSARQVIDEWLRANQHVSRRVEGRLVYE
ncbi:bifunctional metallophosphatase/5'-nucleotidase [Coriobacteriia bacterium Es71-Z0120]|uniref:bifunctional metallophosphatase/5'-nucleotidase n=1 Tax=Parvivirga hydrogeniphila TaxID=2939460 RepID=UPI002260C0F8|nr:bifunctional UDP-sugar hydrolase/5'-nucleotidase [Parvivirga hydrogeniphila]MCL4078304.1 bifunctional metallophosphatase/5'-nucleotidase [Parvivirga hydrogeniphila]